MLTQKYSEEFLEIYDQEGNKGQIIKNIIDTEEETRVELLNWDDSNVVIFLKRFGSVSPQGLNKSMVVLRKFADFICNKEKLSKREYAMEDGIFLQLIDRKQLMSVTLSYEQYVDIKNQLDVKEDGEKIWLRDKVIFELAWEGLLNEEIRLLKENDIEFVMSENGWQVAILNLEDKIVRIEDPEIVEDIKECMRQEYVIRTAKDGRTKKTFYKKSEYLIKPVKVGRDSGETFIKNPRLALSRTFEIGKFSCEGIDLERLSLADIRRSRLIYLLAPENENFFDFKTVAGLYNFRKPDSLKWYKEIAKEKYLVKE